MHQAPYRGEQDGARMLALVREHPAGHAHVVDLPYRLCSWAFDNPDTVCLWEDGGGRLLAWAALQTPFWTLDYGCHPDAPPGAFAAIIEWAEARAMALLGTRYGLPSWYVAVPDGNEARCQALAAAGYQLQDSGEDAWSQVTMALFPGVALPPCPVKVGYRLRPLRGEAEAPAYGTLHRAVFGTHNMTDGWRQAVIRHPAYRPELDLVIEDPAGELVAFCVGWMARLPAGYLGLPSDEPVTLGHIEPIGVREDGRRHGLAWAILAEIIGRMRAVGAETILVQTDNFRDRAFAFYEAAGFRVVERVVFYRRDFPPSPGEAYE